MAKTSALKKLSFDVNQLEASLKTLSASHWAAFAASCAERLIPNYRAFSQEEDWGDPEVLDNAIQAVWRGIATERGQVSENIISDFISACENQMPDSSEFGSMFVQPAQHAVLATLYSLECCTGAPHQVAVKSARVAVETLKDYLYRVNTPYLEDIDLIRAVEITPPQGWQDWSQLERAAYRIQATPLLEQEIYDWLWDAPLMQLELAKQHDDIEVLKHYRHINEDVINLLIETSRASGIRPQLRNMVIV